MGAAATPVWFGAGGIRFELGWGYAQFDDGKPASEAVHNACFACHAIAKVRDFVFNRYAP